jgi:hypothetical protein
VLVVNDALVALEAGAPGQPASSSSPVRIDLYSRNAAGEAARSGAGVTF